MSDRQVKIPYERMKSVFYDKLIKYGFPESAAQLCSRVITDSTCDGVISHGIGRFQSLIKKAKEKRIDVNAVPEMLEQSGCREIWDGKSGIGIVNATKATKRAVALAREFGVGLVALKNNSHWLRGGSYGWQAVKEDCALISWTNTIPNMPAWRGSEPLLGNNPLVIAIPRTEGPMVLDMAMSQYSYGKMGEYKKAGKKMPTVAGYTSEGVESDDPAEVLKSGLPMPAGFWKGSALAMVLDLLAASLSMGSVTAQVVPEENNISQVFLAISLEGQHKLWIDQISIPLLNISNEKSGMRYPGQSVLMNRKKNREEGIPVSEALWNKIVEL